MMGGSPVRSLEDVFSEAPLAVEPPQCDLLEIFFVHVISASDHA